MPAEAFLNSKIEALGNRVTGKFNRFNENDSRRQIVDLKRCLQDLRRLKKAMDSKFGIDISNDVKTYLEDPTD